MFRTARRRLVAWNVFVLSIFLVVLGGTVYGYFYSHIYTGVDQQLLDQRDRVITFLRQAGGRLDQLQFPGSSPFQVGMRTTVTNVQGQVNFSTDCLAAMTIGPTCPSYTNYAISEDAIRDVLATRQEDIRTVYWPEHGPQRVLTYLVTWYGAPLAVFQTSSPAQPEQTALHELGVMIIFACIFGIVLSTIGSLFLANRALVPIRQAFARQRQFTADASHELRTPLALIRANAEMLARHSDRLPPEDGDLMGEIIRETDHLHRLITDLLTLARSDAEKVTVSARPVDLRAMVEEVHENVTHLAEVHGIASEISLNGPVTVAGDEVRLRQLLLILLDNALKYTDPGGHVRITLQGDDNRARLVVSDTGIGIPSADLPRIFDRFYRVDRAREHESGGTGLGLAIAQWIVEAHHGSIKVESELGRGTTFQVELPVA